jgi:hypothetical protein
MSVKSVPEPDIPDPDRIDIEPILRDVIVPWL